MKFDKLVRDKIPEIIADSGKKAIFRVLDKTEYLSYLGKKLDEEVAEFHESKNIEELADIYEVVYALLEVFDVPLESLMAVRNKKRKERGGFSGRICLIETEEKSERCEDGLDKTD